MIYLCFIYPLPFDTSRYSWVGHPLRCQELCSLMEAGGRRIEEYDAYASLCQRRRLGAVGAVGVGESETSFSGVYEMSGL